MNTLSFIIIYYCIPLNNCMIKTICMQEIVMLKVFCKFSEISFTSCHSNPGFVMVCAGFLS